CKGRISQYPHACYPPPHRQVRPSGPWESGGLFVCAQTTRRGVGLDTPPPSPGRWGCTSDPVTKNQILLFKLFRRFSQSLGRSLRDFQTFRNKDPQRRNKDLQTTVKFTIPGGYC